MFFCFFVLAVAAAAVSPEGSWRLVFEDDFDGPTVNSSNWNVYANVSEGTNQIELYTADNVFTTSVGGVGALALRTRPQEVKFDGHSYNVTSGRVDSALKVNITYGRVEVVARLQNDAASGLHSAHWLLGYGCWPACAEIDIMECQSPHNAYAGGAGSGGTWQVVTSNLHTGAACGVETKHTTGTSEYPRAASPAVNFTSQWTTFAVEWNASSLVYFVNSTVVNHVYDGMPGWAGPVRIPSQPMYLILSQAYMAHRPYGDPPAWAWPAMQYIDAVRVYEWDGSKP
jgi:hypothetical protein